MSVQYQINGNTVRVSEIGLDVRSSLPSNIYTVGLTPTGEFILTVSTDKFSLPSKIYGESNDRQVRIINTFKNRKKSTGVLFHGNAGSGKTLIVKSLCNELVSEGYPVLLVTTPHCNDTFKTFINSIKTECVIVFEEFEKVYEEFEQNELLTLLDGVFESKKLFLFTVNNTDRLTSYLINRPGRIYYTFEYNGLSEQTVNEYCMDKLDNQSHNQSILNISQFYLNVFNFDILQSIVSELNLYPNDTLTNILNILNFDIKDNNTYEYTSGTVDGVKKEGLSTTYHGVMSGKKVVVAYEDGRNEDGIYLEWEPHEIVRMDVEKGIIEYGDDEGNSVVLTRVNNKEPHTFNISEIL